MPLPPRDDILLNKAATIERCAARAREEYADDPVGFAASLRRQDAAIMNIQRTCAAALDMGQHLIRRDRLGVSQSSRDVFALLARAGRLDNSLATTMQHLLPLLTLDTQDNPTLQLPMIERIIQHDLDEFLVYSKTLLHAEQSIGN